MDDVSWGALAVSLTVLGGLYTWWALRHRGTVSAVRALGITLLPIAAWLTGLLKVLGAVGDALSNWLVRLVFSPSVWLGLIVAVVAVLLIGGANVVSRRRGPVEPGRKQRPTPTGDPQALGRAQQPRQQPAIDDELAEIEALLKKRGIS